MTAHLIPSWVLNLVEGNHNAVIGNSHIEACEHLGLIAV